MAIAGLAEALDGANTRFQAQANALFAGDLAGSYQLISQEDRLDSGGVLSLQDAGQVGIMREWVGERQYDGFRLYRKDITIKPYEKTFSLARRNLIDDTPGSINRRIDTFLQSQAQVFDYKVWDKLLENPTGIDGDNLISDTHSFGADGGTWDNKTTDALSFASYNTGKVAMRSLKGEAGRFMGLRPTHLFVGPANERTAKEITGADRPVSLDAAGAEGGTGVSATSIVNAYQGDVTVVVVEHLANGTNDNDWFLVDASKGAMPMCLARQRDPELIARVDMDDPRRFDLDMFTWGIEADFGVDAAYPHVIYGRLT